LLTLIYFYAHYGFASISAHALVMYTPFLIVVTLAGSAVVSGRRPASLFLKPLRRADPLRHDALTDLFAPITSCDRNGASWD
jgi:hypothetical protein